MNVLIVEDEPHAQVELERLLNQLGRDIEIVDRIDSVEESVEWLSTQPRPDLIFLDIQLSDGLSFEIFNQVEVDTPVIFTTAYDAYALQAFQLNSIDYLLKPVEEDALARAVDKYERTQQPKNTPAPVGFSPDQLDALRQLHRPTYKRGLVARVGDQIKHLRVEEAAWFYAENNLVYVVTRQGKELIIDYKLEQLEELLDPTRFMRLNRTFLAQIDSIGKINRYFNSRLKVELLPKTDKEVLISRANVKRFVAWMDA